MDDEIEPMLVEIRASTSGFENELKRLGNSVDHSLVGGLEKAGNVLERGLVSAIRRGSLSFDDLKRSALSALDQIASHALQIGLDSILSGGGAGGNQGGGLLGGFLNAGISALLGLPGRATGGPVSPLRPYLVGERGPELFVPTSAGRVEPNSTVNGAAKNVNIALSVRAPRGQDAPVAMQRSARQVASALRRALREQ